MRDHRIVDVLQIFFVVERLFLVSRTEVFIRDPLAKVERRNLFLPLQDTMIKFQGLDPFVLDRRVECQVSALAEVEILDLFLDAGPLLEALRRPHRIFAYPIAGIDHCF